MTDLLDLRELGEQLRRYAARTVLVGLIGCAVGVGLLRVTPETYQSTAMVLVAAAPGVLVPDIAVERDPNKKPSRLRTPDTEAQLIRSGGLLDRVNARLAAGMTRSELTEHIRVSAPPNTRVLNIAFVAETPQLAQRGADLVSREYVSTRRKMLDDRIRRVSAALWQRRDVLRTRLTKVDAEMKELEERAEQADPDDAADIGAAIEPTRQAARTRRGQLTEQLRAIDRGLAGAASAFAIRTEVVRAAALPTAPAKRNGVIPPLSGLLGGALAGLLWGYVRDRRRPRVRNAGHVTQALGLPVFAQLGTRERMRGLATEIRLASAHRVLVTGVAHPSHISAVGKLLRTALAYVDEPGEVLVFADSPSSAYTLREAQNVDLVLLVAERRRSSLDELRDAARLLSRSSTPAAVVLTPHARRWRRRRR